MDETERPTVDPAMEQSFKQMMLESVNYRGEKLEDVALANKIEEIKGDMVTEVDLTNNELTETGALALVNSFKQVSILGLANNKIASLG